ncbi:MAG: hypothetical protein KJO31_18520 [Gammaproteobacteria bacterium]|nr:hypothetical protein [Gammaproteobacteria bacterium]
MTLRKSLLALLLALPMPLLAEIITVVEAVETAAANLNVPPGPNGRLSFRACGANCDEDLTVVRLTPATTYTVRGQALDFKDFRKEFYNLRPGNSAYALVTYDTERDTVVSVLIDEQG